jgi:anti-sigma factor ChrR (cupin superfamily)
MALPQNIAPVNSEVMDALTPYDEGDWIEQTPGKAWIRILWIGAETGAWAVVFRWNKGFVAGQHKHLSASHTYILKGKLRVRDGDLNAGDYVYEANGMIHGATTALEDTEYLFICNGPILFYNDDQFTGYLGWEEVTRLRDRHRAAKQSAGRSVAAG